jgi:hypothetical protein
MPCKAEHTHTQRKKGEQSSKDLCAAFSIRLYKYLPLPITITITSAMGAVQYYGVHNMGY